MGRMSDALLGDEPFVERKAEQLARRQDPSTSFRAADGIVHRLRPIQMKVIEVLDAVGPEGLTDLELEERCGNHGSTFRTRRAELAEVGLVVDTGRHKVLNGTKRIVWALKKFYP